ncbi:hypothetical protein BDY21DRAFT_366795 [Lineolata rhizophorae]|uniref:Uncharacterized protein n=1 Tax=Lineolata rhizophorae TaxID=578093 RepID=A0A6A6NQ41_9PEZI|nr:hypothetical protein BDY21DRAFT_366795 [Lineolata rhizophorae]
MTEAMRPGRFAALTNFVIAYQSTNKIISLERVSNWEEKGDPTKGFAKPVRNEIIAQLKKIVPEFRRASKELLRHKQRKYEHAAERQRREREAILEAKAAEKAKRKNKWYALHVERLDVEPDPRRLGHLRMTERRHVDVDANGLPFERVAVFCPRNSRAYPLLNAEMQAEWSDEEKAALIDGLREYEGPEVFECIFQKYCRPGGPLRPYSVLQITTQAARLRKYFVGDNTADHGIESWMLNIPTFE